MFRLLSMFHDHFNAFDPVDRAKLVNEDLIYVVFHLQMLNGSLIGMERTIDLNLGGCATQTSQSDVLSYVRDQCIIDAKCEELQCISNYFKAFKITVKVYEKEKLLSGSILPRGVINNYYFKPRVAHSHGRRK